MKTMITAVCFELYSSVVLRVGSGSYFLRSAFHLYVILSPRLIRLTRPLPCCIVFDKSSELRVSWTTSMGVVHACLRLMIAGECVRCSSYRQRLLQLQLLLDLLQCFES
jgi:hypothetical protein